MSKIKKEMSPRVTPAGLPAFRSIHDMMSTLTAAISLGSAVADRYRRIAKESELDEVEMPEVVFSSIARSVID